MYIYIYILHSFKNNLCIHTNLFITPESIFWVFAPQSIDRKFVTKIVFRVFATFNAFPSLVPPITLRRSATKVASTQVLFFGCSRV